VRRLRRSGPGRSAGRSAPADHTLLLTAVQTGLRVSELTGLTIAGIHLGTGPHVYCRGKGRKERCTPLTTQTAAALTSWLAERGGHGPDPLFCTRRGGPLNRDAVERLLAKYVTTAAGSCPSLQAKTVSPHTLRHSAAIGTAARRRRRRRHRALARARITGLNLNGL
jgi:integrase/recombinase XerD